MPNLIEGTIKAGEKAQATGQSAKIYSPQDLSKEIFIPNVSYTKDGLGFMANNADSTINAINQQALWNREDDLRKAAELREDYSMDRIVAAAKRNGINPIFLMDALGGNTVGNAASYTTSAAKANNYDTSARTNEANSAKIFGNLLTAIGIIVAALL